MMISSKQITASFGKALYAEDRPLFAEKNRYSTSAVVILLLELEGEQHILFQKRVLDIAQGGEVSLPGGRSEQNETAQQTALRECCEELGVSSQWITLYGRMGRLVSSSGALIDPFIGFLKCKNLDELPFNPKEAEYLFAVPVSFFFNSVPLEYAVRLMVEPHYITSRREERILLPSQDLGLPEKYHQPWGAKKLPVYLYQWQGELIWGITADIIREFIEIISTTIQK